MASSCQHQIAEGEQGEQLGLVLGQPLVANLPVAEEILDDPGELAWVILVHNHPSGDPEPSDADRLITKRLKEALGLMDIRVIEHVLVGSD